MRRVSKAPPKTKGKSAPRRRPRAKPLLTRTRVRLGGAGLALVLVALGGWQIWQGRWIQDGSERAVARLVAASAALGFRVDQITVDGRVETPLAKLRAALRLSRGEPMFGFDPYEAHVRIKSLPWVRSVAIERQLPGTVALHLVERHPIALWQKDGAFSLIDAEGAVIPIDDVARFNNLVVVVGDDAPPHAADLMAMLANVPALGARVRAAVWIGKRRWDVYVDGKVRVMLPEDDPAAAWRKLGELDRDDGLLARNYSVIDLRLKDRMIVRQAPDDEKHKDTGQRNT